VQCQSAEDDDVAPSSDYDDEQVPVVRLIPQTYMTRQAPANTPAFPADTAATSRATQPPTPADGRLNTDYSGVSIQRTQRNATNAMNATHVRNASSCQ